MADPTTTQNINYGFAPEAAPYAQDLLGQAQSLTDINANPYQQYQGDTIAQFTPLQNLAYGNAATMSSAPQLNDASALAGMAGLGGLNQQYTFQPSNFTQANYNQMANPYLDVMNSATNRNAQIQQAASNAQATTAGAFGGGRQAVMNAQNNADLQRNLGKNQFDAYNQAQTQYNTQNQLNAQQQQFGAGLGLQGLQTANQAATNLANIGQTQYGQNMGINQLQNQYGGQQQQQVQNGLNQQQQQFLNYQNYPYQQLNFMQNMIRGLPMTNQTASVYQSPGSMLGQVAGLGIGAAAALNKKEGGAISSFKEGGHVKKFGGGGDITDPSEGKLHRMISDLSDGQLQLILQHPTSMAEMQSAQLEMSSRHGGMREGGAVAFAGGGSNDDTAQQENDRGAISNVFRHLNAAGMDILTLPGRGVAGAAESVITRPLRALGVPIPYLPESFYGGNRNSISPYSDKLMQEEDTNKYAKQKDDMSDYVPRSGANPTAVKEAWKKPEIKAGLSDVAKNAPSLGEARKTAESMGVKSEDFDSIYKRIYGDLSKGNADIIKSIKELTEEQVGEAKNIKAEGGRKALMNFGFNLAAEASRPGVAGNQGFAGLLRSAAAASPSYAASLADTDKMARESQRLANQMQIEMTKYQVALKKGDETAAMSAAHTIQSTQIQQQHLAEVSTHNRKMEGLEGQKIGMMGQRYAAMQGQNQFKYGNFKRQAMQQADKNYNDELKNNIMFSKELKQQGITPDQYKKRRADEIYGNILQSVAGPLMPLEE